MSNKDVDKILVLNGSILYERNDARKQRTESVLLELNDDGIVETYRDGMLVEMKGFSKLAINRTHTSLLQEGYNLVEADFNKNSNNNVDLEKEKEDLKNQIKQADEVQALKDELEDKLDNILDESKENLVIVDTFEKLPYEDFKADITFGKLKDGRQFIESDRIVMVFENGYDAITKFKEKLNSNGDSTLEDNVDKELLSHASEILSDVEEDGSAILNQINESKKEEAVEEFKLNTLTAEEKQEINDFIKTKLNDNGWTIEETANSYVLEKEINGVNHSYEFHKGIYSKNPETFISRLISFCDEAEFENADDVETILDFHNLSKDLKTYKWKTKNESIAFPKSEFTNLKLSKKYVTEKFSHLEDFKNKLDENQLKWFSDKNIKVVEVWAGIKDLVNSINLNESEEILSINEYIENITNEEEM